MKIQVSNLTIIKQTKKYEIFERVSDTNSQEVPSSYTFYHSAWTFHNSGYRIMIKNIPVIQVYSFTLLYFSRPSQWPTNSPITSSPFTSVNNLLHHVYVSICLLQFGGCDPDLSVCRDVFSGLVQDFSGILICL